VTAVVEREVRSGEVRLNVAEAGDGPPVILLHGFPDSWRLWRYQVDALGAAGHRVLAPDLRGFGVSDRPGDVEAYRMPLLVGDVLAVLDDAGIERATVVGHDWGAGLAWQVALRRPERVERLVAVSVGHPDANVRSGLDQHRMSWYMLWFLFPGVAEDVLPRDDWRFFREWAWGGAERGENADCERQIDELSRPGALTAALNWYRANIRAERYVLADPPPGRPVRCPTMGVWSSADQFLGEPQMARSGDYVDGPWRYERVACDHWVPVHAGDSLNRLLMGFIG
jgi:pimeloyl-ACP methyl ester carboxylesterase